MRAPKIGMIPPKEKWLAALFKLVLNQDDISEVNILRQVLNLHFGYIHYYKLNHRQPHCFAVYIYTYMMCVWQKLIVSSHCVFHSSTKADKGFIIILFPIMHIFSKELANVSYVKIFQLISIFIFLILIHCNLYFSYCYPFCVM